ncbi:MAG: 3-methyl-2-oxobutanoate hydroxymethyltransferase [archaeon]
MVSENKFQKIRSMKGKEKIVMLTSYDFVTASYIKEAGIDLVLVGDSVGNVLLGYKNTLPVSMQDMIHHTRAVFRAGLDVPIIGDMPNGSYLAPEIAVENAKKFLDAGAGAVKVEGAVIDVVAHLRKNGVEVMGHVGLTPQTISEWHVQGRGEPAAQKILSDAIALERAGCFSVVVESVPAGLGKKISQALKVPTIGIGAGADCDGQVLVINDLLGLNAGDFRPKFVKQYLNMRPQVIGALKEFKKDVKEKKFPAKENTYT